jgi:3-phenylpropionate/cinnamic acid dioxygenase small subunit
MGALAFERTELQELVVKEDIRNLLTGYAEALDYRQWHRLESIFAQQVFADYGGTEIVRGRADLIAMIRRYLDGCGPTQHLLGNFTIDIREGVATSRCYVRGMHAGVGARASAIYDFWGEYRDRLVLTHAGWRITERVEHVFHFTGDSRVFAPG